MEGRLTLLRITSRVFLDLAVWMTGLGLVIGLAFPFAIIPLGVPADRVLRPTFFLATVVAGLLVGAINFVLARRVVGLRLRRLSHGMRHVGKAVEEATYSGDWSRCSPEACHLEVDSEDELGDAARSFNELLDSLAESRRVERAMTGFAAVLSSHLELEESAEAALHGLLDHALADAGALCLIHDGELSVQASHRLDPATLCESPTLQAAVRQRRVTVADVPSEVTIDAGVVTFRPETVVVLPIEARSGLVAAVILAFRTAVTPQSLRLLEGLRGTVAVALNNALAHQRIQELAARDPLTGLFNRRVGLRRLDEELAAARLAHRPLSVLAIDLDHFKSINDEHGHAAGDRVLVAVASELAGALREEDFAIRTGGEEFVAILPGVTLAQAVGIAERLRLSVAALVVAGSNRPLAVTASVGVASSLEAGCSTAQELLLAVDTALYSAKGSGRNRVIAHAVAS